MAKPTVAQRLWARVNRDAAGGCWLWTGSLDRDGYGWFSDVRPRHVHRVAYELQVGPIPAGLMVLHRCDQPACVNPEHLFVGTNADNMRDMAIKERSRSTKLSAADVDSIRRSSEHREVLANRFGISTGHVTKIRRGAHWKHLPERCASVPKRIMRAKGDTRRPLSAQPDAQVGVL